MSFVLKKLSTRMTFTMPWRQSESLQLA